MSAYREYVLNLTLEKYLLGELDKKTNDVILKAASEIVLDFAPIILIEITYHIGYAKSLLLDKMCETTYKTLKKRVKDNLLKNLERGEQ